jgi:hypothetical protein
MYLQLSFETPGQHCQPETAVVRPISTDVDYLWESTKAMNHPLVRVARALELWTFVA